MYSIPNEFKIENLKDALISQISFSLNTITIFFENSDFINIQGNFAISLDNQRIEYVEIFPIKADFGLLRLLGKKVINIELNLKRDALKLKIEEDIILELIGNEMYESFTISIQGQEALV
jgi:hypothetical protein